MPLKAHAQTGLVPCEFLIDRPPHVRGDVVGLLPALAERLIERGVAEAIDLKAACLKSRRPPSERRRSPSADRMAGPSPAPGVKLASEIAGRTVEPAAANTIITKEVRRHSGYIPLRPLVPGRSRSRHAPSMPPFFGPE